jgi:mRNA interferase YafQ
MRTIKFTSKFSKDYKREIKSGHFPGLEAALRSVLELLISDTALPRKFVDHALTGQWKDHRDCHLRPDLILIYRLPNPEALELVRLGSHSELGL